MSKINFSSPLWKYTNKDTETSIAGKTVVHVLDDLEITYPALKDILRDDQGNVRKAINIFVNNDDIRTLDSLNTQIDEHDEIFIIPTITGG